VTPEDFCYFLAGGRAAAASGADQFSSFAEVRGADDRRGYDGKLLHILTAEVIEAVHRASGDAQRLPRPHLDGSAVNRPSQDALDTVKDLLVAVVLVRGRRQLLSPGNDKLVPRRPRLVCAGGSSPSKALTSSTTPPRS